MKIQDLQNGDLIFTVGRSDMAEAIRTATGSYSHVSIFFDGQIYHATEDRGVIRERMADFFQEEDIYDVFFYPDIDLAAVHEQAKIHLGSPYNHSFYPQNAGFYCSEYIAEILPIFETIPMQFGDGEAAISPFWQIYYQDLGLSVPLGQPGTNPSQLARSDKLIFKGGLND